MALNSQLTEELWSLGASGIELFDRVQREHADKSPEFVLQEVRRRLEQMTSMDDDSPFTFGDHPDEPIGFHELESGAGPIAA